MLGHEPNPGGEIAARSEGFGIGDGGDQRGGKRGADAGHGVKEQAGVLGSMPDVEGAFFLLTVPTVEVLFHMMA